MSLIKSKDHIIKQKYHIKINNLKDNQVKVNHQVMEKMIYFSNKKLNKRDHSVKNQYI